MKILSGVLDRFSDRDQAVILIEEIKQEVVIHKSELPEGSRPNMWFTINMKEDKIIEIAIDHVKTEIKAQRSADLMSKLRSKSRGSKFKRK